MRIKQRWISNQFNTIPAKQLLSGLTFSDSQSIKSIFVFDRRNMSLLAASIVNQDDSWNITCPLRENEQLIILCRDEGSDYNADIYDRVSLCTDNYSPLSYHNNLIIT